MPVPLSHHLLRKICIFFQRAIPSKFRCHQLLKTPTQFIIGCLVPCMSVQVLAIAVNPHPVKPRGRQRLCELCDSPVGISGLCSTASAYQHLVCLWNETQKQTLRQQLHVPILMLSSDRYIFEAFANVEASDPVSTLDKHTNMNTHTFACTHTHTHTHITPCTVSSLS